MPLRIRLHQPRVEPHCQAHVHSKQKTRSCRKTDEVPASPQDDAPRVLVAAAAGTEVNLSIEQSWCGKQVRWWPSVRPACERCPAPGQSHPGFFQ